MIFDQVLSYFVHNSCKFTTNHHRNSFIIEFTKLVTFSMIFRHKFSSIYIKFQQIYQFQVLINYILSITVEILQKFHHSQNVNTILQKFRQKFKNFLRISPSNFINFTHFQWFINIFYHIQIIFHNNCWKFWQNVMKNF